MTSQFDRAATPSPRSFYPSELGALPRENSGGWTSAECCFHKSETRGRKRSKPLRVNLRQGHFRCMSCDAHGHDVIDFMRLRYKLDFKTAAQRLGAWKNLDADDRKRIARDLADREALRARTALLDAEKKQDRFAARELLHSLERTQNKVSQELARLERESPGVESKVKDQLLISLVMLCDQIRDADQNYRLLSGLDQL